MAQFGNDNRAKTGTGLPVPIEAPAVRLPVRGAASANFVSQLLAARDRLETQRPLRRASVTTALDAYRAGSGIAVRRMPQGYRRTIVV